MSVSQIGSRIGLEIDAGQSTIGLQSRLLDLLVARELLGDSDVVCDHNRPG